MSFQGENQWLGTRSSKSSSLASSSAAVFRGASADTSLIDNFDDGDDNGWVHVDNTVLSPWGPGIFDASSDNYTLATSGVVSEDPFGISDTLFSEWTGSSAPQYANGFWRARMRANMEGTLFYLILRRSGGNGYAFGGATDQNSFFISRVDDAVNIPLQELNPPPTPVIPGEDWIVEAGAIGSQLSLKVWRDGDAIPDAPQLTVIDPTYGGGTFLVGARRDTAFQGMSQVVRDL